MKYNYCPNCKKYVNPVMRQSQIIGTIVLCLFLGILGIVY